MLTSHWFFPIEALSADDLIAYVRGWRQRPSRSILRSAVRSSSLTTSPMSSAQAEARERGSAAARQESRTLGLRERCPALRHRRVRSGTEPALRRGFPAGTCREEVYSCSLRRP